MDLVWNHEDTKRTKSVLMRRLRVLRAFVVKLLSPVDIDCQLLTVNC
jgi:hypothetical protein